LRKIIAILSATITLLSMLPLVTPTTNNMNSSMASVSVMGTCDVTASDVNFGTLLPGASSSLDTTLHQINGNTVTTSLAISGTAWTGGIGMPVSQTTWATNTTFTPLSTTPAELAVPLDSVTPMAVHLTLAVPAHQAAVAYTQTITFDVQC